MYAIRIEDCGHDVRCRPGQTLLDAARQSGAACIRVGCLGGGCGVCRVRIISGTYAVGKMSRGHVREEAQAAGFALACKVTPQSDLVLEVMSSGHDAEARPWRFRRPDGVRSGED